MKAVKEQLCLLFVAAVILAGLSGCVADTSPERPSVATDPTGTASYPTATLPRMSTETSTPPPFETPTALPTATATPSAAITATPALGQETEATPGASGDIPLAIGISGPESVAIFNKYAREQDVIGARVPYIDLLGEVETGQKMLVLAPQDEEDLELESVIAEAQTKGVSILGYNLETALPEGELVERETQMQQLAGEADLLYVFAPTLRKLMQHYDSFARHADVVLLQSQRFQATAGYEEQIEDLIAKIKAAAPGVQVWVQVSVAPPEKRSVTADEVIHDIQLVADKADLIWIFFSPKTISIMEEVLRQMRQ